MVFADSADLRLRLPIEVAMEKTRKLEWKRDPAGYRIEERKKGPRPRWVGFDPLNATGRSRRRPIALDSVRERSDRRKRVGVQLPQSALHN